MTDEPEILGDWSREKILGCGGFGVVTLWGNDKTNEKIAIKKYRGENDTLSQKHKERWSQEVDMMKRINNDNIVKFYVLPTKFEDALNKYNNAKLPMLSMEFCAEGDLRTVLSKSENCCGLSECDVRCILKDLMNAVSYLHELKITHRDLKPENIVLNICDRPNGIIYKLIDLGYAKELDAKSICASFVGTLQYLAPELLYSKTYSCSVDYWSMGLVAFEIMCGTRPFLPNKSPAQWMYEVNKKTHDIICIYQTESEASVVSSKEIFAENLVSSCFKGDIEKWLQLALEYNPRQRGRNSENELEIFTCLKNILCKKIVTVFSMCSTDVFSYEIDECTQVTTLQGWIERDTKILKSEQLLLSFKCDSIDLHGLATQFFDESYCEPMLYVFKKSELVLRDIKRTTYPASVRDMLVDASVKQAYYYQKRSYAHALYYIFKETTLYNTILDACHLRIKYISKICDHCTHLCRQMNVSIQQLISQKDFSKQILEFDFEQYLKNYSQKAEHWNESFNKICERIDKLYGICSQITVRQESVYRRATALNVCFNKEYSKHNSHDLNELLDEALSCYSLIKCKPKDERNKKESSKGMANILFEVLRTCHKLLTEDITLKKYLQMIVDIEKELEKIATPMKTAIEHIEKYYQELKSDHTTRQSKIWDFTIKQKNKSKTQDSNKPNFMIGNPKIPCEEYYCKPITLDKPLHFILGDTKQNLSSIESCSSFHSTEDSPVYSDTDQISVETKKPANIDSKPHTTQNQIQVVDKQTGSNINSEQAIYANSEIISKDNRGNDELKTVLVSLPNFSLGAPASVVINNNLSLQNDLQEQTNSLMQIRTNFFEELDFSFLKCD